MNEKTVESLKQKLYSKVEKSKQFLGRKSLVLLTELCTA